MRIGELTARTGVSARLLRYYEEQELLAPRRTASGYRVFAESDVARVNKIRSLLSTGLGTSVIARILACLDERQVDIVPLCPAVLEELELHRRRVESAAEAVAVRAARVDALIEQAMRREPGQSVALW